MIRKYKCLGINILVGALCINAYNVLNKEKKCYESYSSGSNSHFIAYDSNEGNYIKNYKYFEMDPFIGDNSEDYTYGNNNAGTCGVIAAQLLLGYHNYYSDRRIIEDKYLYGYYDDHVSRPEENPNTCSDPTKFNKTVISTTSGNESSSFYYKLVTSMMRPNESGIEVSRLQTGIINYMSERNFENYTIDFDVKSNFALSRGRYIDPSIIKLEIDKNRPIILATSSELGGDDHDVVCYGYETHIEDGVERTGYIVNYGWQRQYHNYKAWIDARWVMGYIKLDINHTHKYRYYDEYNSYRDEYRCVTCGHRTDSAYELDSEKRYDEKKFYLDPGETKEIILSCFRDAEYLIQTFGPKDTIIALYDKNNNILRVNDDFGYMCNSLLRYNFDNDESYKLTIRFYNENDYGFVKIGSCCPRTVIDNYMDIPTITSDSITFFTYYYHVEILRFIPSQAGIYQIDTFYLNGEEDGVDNYLYLITPSSISAALYNDDDAGDYQARITLELEANNEYVIIVSQYNVSLGTETIGIEITRLS